MNKTLVLPVLFGMFCSVVVMTNAVSANVITVGPFVCVAGALLYPVTFLLTDIISDVYGRRTATWAVWCGFACQILAAAFVQFAALFPSLNAEVQAAWGLVFLPMFRIALASMVAYLSAQLLDVSIFHKIKRKTKGRHLWLRNNVATSVSQALDTAIFVTVAFLGVLPWPVLWSMVVGQYLLKVVLAILDTPICYLGVYVVRRLEARNER